MKDKKVNIILLIGFIVVVLLLSIVLNKQNKKEVSQEEVKEYELVNDYSTFYTIEDCANRFYNYLSLGDKDNLNKLLYGTYDLDNLIKKYGNMNINIKVNEMYFLENSYYLKGYLYEEILNGLNKLDENYLNIKISDDEKYFKVIILDKEEFERVTNGK